VADTYPTSDRTDNRHRHRRPASRSLESCSAHALRARGFGSGGPVDPDCLRSGVRANVLFWSDTPSPFLIKVVNDRDLTECVFDELRVKEGSVKAKENCMLTID
jgi:hypothetical protein